MLKIINRSRVPAVNRVRARAKQRVPTRSEEQLWRVLSGSQLGTGFRRQVPIGNFIVDFLAPAARLVVEVDGDWHAGRAAADARRDRLLVRSGFRVLRVSAQAVLQSLPEVVRSIRQELRP